MRKITNGLLILSLLLLAACAGESTSETKGGKKDKALKEAPGGKYYGGIFTMNDTEYFRSLFPLNIGEVVGHRIGNQIYEGLVKLSQTDLSVQPAIAEKYTVSEDGKVYTFTLRKGVMFHDDPCFEGGKGREVTIKDIKYCLDRLCVKTAENKGYEFVSDRIVGAKEYNAAASKGSAPAEGVSGIKVLDDSTIQISLVQPFASFASILSMPFGYIYPKEAMDKYGSDMREKTVGTGPFYLKNLQPNQGLVLLRNEKYWAKDEQGNQRPYLDGIRWSFISDQKGELMAFKKGNLDMTYRLPLEMIDEVLDANKKLKPDYAEFQFQETPSLSIYYYGFKNKGELFNNKKLRQAFSYAIDKQKIVDYTMKGGAVPGHYGVVPPSFKDYNNDVVQGYKYDPKKAQQLMAEAGYPNGKGFPELTLQINSGGTRNEQIAEAAQKMLTDNLNIKLQISKVPWPQHLEATETGKCEFWRYGWIADYPDPENFLNLFLSKHVPATFAENAYINSPRYVNPEFDKVMEQALATVDKAERYKLYQKADKIMIDDAPILPIYYEIDRRLVQSYVRNFDNNSMEYRDLGVVWFEPTDAFKRNKLN